MEATFEYRNARRIPNVQGEIVPGPRARVFNREFSGISSNGNPSVISGGSNIIGN